MQQFIDGDTYEDNVWSRLIKEKLNIELEVAFSADTTTDAYKQKMNVMLASGEFPDVVRWSDRTFFKQAQEAGFIQPIGPAFDAYATDAVKEYQTDYAEAFEGATIDGVLYAFPYMNDNFHQAYNLWIRDDWLENTGTEPPKTVEEMVELARIFTEEDPDGDGVRRYIRLCSFPARLRRTTTVRLPALRTLSVFRASIPPAHSSVRMTGS